MEHFLYYLLRASVLMTLFYGIYRLLFAKNTFHAANRFSLIAIVLASSLLPLFRFNLLPERKPDTFTVMLPADLSSNPVSRLAEMQPQIEIPWVRLVTVLFAAGLLLSIVRYMIGRSRINTIIRQSEKQTISSRHVLCVTDENISPFCWMKYIVLSREDLSADNQAVIRHEMAHIELGHSYDMILFNFFTCLFWFNPFAWLLRKEIESVHEYQADARVLNQGIDPKQYQLLLIRKGVGDLKFALANNFRQRDLLKRITMMKKNKTNQQLKWRYALALPTLFLAMVALSVPKLYADNSEEKNNETIPNEMDLGKTDIVPKDSVKVTVLGTNHSNLNVFTDDDKPLVFVDHQKITYEEFQKVKPEDIHAISVLKEKSATEIYGDEGENGVILITTKKYHAETVPMDGESKDAQQESKEIKKVEIATGTTQDKVEIKIVETATETTQDEAETTTESTKNGTSHGNTGKLIISTKGDNQPLYIVDEVIISGEELQEIKAEDIESISVLKDNSATQIYGDKGKNGVIIIKTKKK